MLVNNDLMEVRTRIFGGGGEYCVNQISKTHTHAIGHFHRIRTEPALEEFRGPGAKGIPLGRNIANDYGSIFGRILVQEDLVRKSAGASALNRLNGYRGTVAVWFRDL